jgi:hypothetical protein
MITDMHIASLSSHYSFDFERKTLIPIGKSPNTTALSISFYTKDCG